MAVSLKGAVACVTGGGRGSGKASAAALASRGAKVVIGDIDFEHAQAVAKAIGPAAIAVKLDVADPASFAAFVETCPFVPAPLLVAASSVGLQALRNTSNRAARRMSRIVRRTASLRRMSSVEMICRSCTASSPILASSWPCAPRCRKTCSRSRCRR